MESQRLEAHQLDMPERQLDLDASQIEGLHRGLQDVGDPSATPVLDAVSEGAGSLGEDAVALPGLAGQASDGEGLADEVAALQPKDTRVEVEGDSYAVMARLNPWYQVAGGSIVGVNAKSSWNNGGLAAASDWHWLKKGDALAAGLTATSGDVGQPWPMGGVSAAAPSASCVPSATYDPSAQSSGFHSLPHDRLPSVPDGYHWTGGGSVATPYQAMRDPSQCPVSPGYDVQSQDVSGRTTYMSSVSQPQPHSLSAYAEAAPQGSGYPGPRNYPMTNDDYETVSGRRMGRGHGIDHTDGDAATTSNPLNYVPEDRHFNEGARNHATRALSRTGGAYAARYQYPAAPELTQDGTPVPSRELFSQYPSGGAPTHLDVPNDGSYPHSRSQAAASSYAVSTPSWGVPDHR